MNRKTRVTRLLFAMLIMVGMLGAWPTGGVAQDPGTPGSSLQETTEPTVVPTQEPTIVPTDEPVDPTDVPVEPTTVPTEEPAAATETPAEPTDIPDEPTVTPTVEPTVTATEAPADPDASPESSSRIQALLADGTVVISVRNQNGDLLPDACFSVYRPDAGSNSLGSPVDGQCDGREDGVADGQLTFVLPPGDYVLIETFAPQGYISGLRTSFSLAEGQQLPLTVTNELGGVDVQIHKVDENLDPLGQACFGIYEDNGGGQVGLLVSANCDAPQGDPGDGVNYFVGIAPGNYVAVETRVPTGYLSTGNTLFTVPSGSTALVNVTVENTPAASPGNLIVNKVDENSQPLPGACFNLWEDAGGGQIGNFVDQRCDFEDGQLVFTGLDPDTYVLTESHAPDGYINGFQTTVTISSDQATTRTVPNVPGGSNITIRKVDAGTGALLTGACFSVYRDTGSGQPTANTFLEGRCDDSEGSNNGLTPFTGLAAGNYILEEFQAPDGYLASDYLTSFSVDGTTDSTVIVENTPIDAPGNLVIDKVDGGGNPLPGACFVVFLDAGGGQAGAYVNGACDWGDGRFDGTTVIAGLDPGNYVVRETLAPDGYRFGGERLVTIPATGATATGLTVTNVLGGTTVTFSTLDQNGAPLGGACFNIYLDDGSGQVTAGSFFTQGCTQPNLAFTGFPPGDYILRVSEPPAGYGYPGYVFFTVAEGATEQAVTVRFAPETAAEAIVRQLIEILISILASR